jgi:hypothetical protein
MPGRFQPPSVGDRPAKAQSIMDTVYEKARGEGYPKARAAKIGWGAVHRAGFDPDHFDNDIDQLREVIADLQAKDEYLDEQAERLGLKYEPAFLPRRSRIISGARRAVRTGARVRGRLRSIRPTIRTRSRTRTPTRRTTIPATRRTPSYIADPARLVKPIDLPGYDNLNNVRFVPRDDSPGYYPTRGLVEGQIVLPQHQFLKSLDVIEANPEYGHVELTDENGDGFIDRFVVRGPKDASRPKRQNVGLFVDIAKPLKNERLDISAWRLE